MHSAISVRDNGCWFLAAGRWAQQNDLTPASLGSAEDSEKSLILRGDFFSGEQSLPEKKGFLRELRDLCEIMVAGF